MTCLEIERVTVREMKRKREMVRKREMERKMANRKAGVAERETEVVRVGEKREVTQNAQHLNAPQLRVGPEEQSLCGSLASKDDGLPTHIELS